MTTWAGAATLTNSTNVISAPTIGYPKVNPEKTLSGIIINQNQIPGAVDYLPADGSWVYQEFFLPTNYTRGGHVPNLTGFQIFVGIDAATSDTATIEWTLEYYQFGVGWTNLTRGRVVGTHSEGDKVWFDIYCDESIDVTQIQTERFRLRFRGSNGVNRYWYSTPNPLVNSGNSRAFREEFFYRDSFSTNTFGNYTVKQGSGLSVSGGKLVVSSTGNKEITASTLPAISDGSATIKLTTTGGIPQVRVQMRRFNDTNYLEAIWNNGGVGYRFAIRKFDSGSFTSLIDSNPSGLTSGNSYWLRLNCTLALLRAELWNSDPILGGTAAQSLSYSLTGANLTKFGPGVTGAIGLFFAPGNTSNTFDDFTVITTTSIPGSQTVVSPLNFGGEASFLFRVLAATADDGTDLFGNQYRSIVVKNPATNTTTLEGERDAYWLSKPNPSRFAIENLYFDMRDRDGKGQVVDRLLLDPITPDVYFHLYYSNEGSAGQNESEWEDKLWTHIPYTFQMRKRQIHSLPEPVFAKYIKVEFSHLQAKYYSPGSLQTPLKYKKHPKWVLDYFLLRSEADRMTEDYFIARRVNVTYDALEIAYNYYLDDLRQAPNAPTEIPPLNVRNINQFYSDRTDLSDVVDPNTLSQIDLILKPYLQQPGLKGKLDYLLGAYTSVVGITGLQNQTADYPVEALSTNLAASTADVSSVNRDPVILEQTFPVMFFFLTCRHRYRVVSALFERDKAYFVGVRQMAFLRDHYSSVHDDALYIESGEDNLNIRRTDFVSVNHALQTYDDAN